MNIWIFNRMLDAFTRSFENIYKYETEGYTTREVIIDELNQEWGEGVADAYRDYALEREEWD